MNVWLRGIARRLGLIVLEIERHADADEAAETSARLDDAEGRLDVIELTLENLRREPGADDDLRR